MSLESLLNNDLATLMRSTQTGDASGGINKSFASVADDVPVRIEDSSASAMRRYAVENIVVTHSVITKEASGRIGDCWDSSDGRRMLIKGVVKRRGIGTMPTFYRYDCEETRPGA